MDLGEGIDSSRSGIRRRGQVGTLLGGDETRSLKTRQYLSELDGSGRVDGFRNSKVMISKWPVLVLLIGDCLRQV